MYSTNFVFFSSSDESSWKKATDLLVEVASHGEDTGYEVPCLIVAAKDDLDSFPLAIQDSTRVIFCSLCIIQIRLFTQDIITVLIFTLNSYTV